MSQLLQRFLRFVDLCLPASVRDAQDQERFVGRSFVMLTLSTGPVLASITPFLWYYERGRGNLFFIALLAGCSHLLNFFLYKRGLSTDRVGRLLCMEMWLLAVILGSFNGGFSVSNMAWLITLPVIAGFLVDFQWVIRYSLLLLFTMLIFYLLEIAGVPFPAGHDVGQFPLIGLLHHCALLLFVAALIVIYSYNNKTANQQLEQTLDDLSKTNTALEQEKERVEVASQTKSRFLANVSHELRTPLNAILGYSELMIEDAEEDDSKSTLQDLQRINQAGRQLLSLINEILDLSKIEAGKHQYLPRPFVLGELLCTIQDHLCVLAREKNNQLRFHYPENTIIFTDQSKLKQIVTNLLSNACKFTRDGEIECTAIVEKEAGTLTLEVKDTGIGIDPSHQPRLFDAFYQVDGSSTRKHGGTGLGLSICQQFARLMGGELSVQSAVGKGSTFTLRLPLDQEKHSEPFSSL